MKQLLFQKGEVLIEEVPPPLPEKGRALIGVHCSLISPGTELSGLSVSGKSLWEQAHEQPEKIYKALRRLKTKGMAETLAKVRKVHQAGSEIWPGYSCSGVVERNSGLPNLREGEKVACAGAGVASHAEIVSVPRNLLVNVPPGLGLREAASVALGSIALQGVRRAGVNLGETAVVIGLGLVGQLTAQLLKVAGCRVIVLDRKRNRVELAARLGTDSTFSSDEIDPASEVLRLTSNRGADVTIICAATESDLPLQQAMEMTRKKGRVIIVGSVGMNVKRQPFYEKELDLLISRSYGPGRYDPAYELNGRDYPFPYVRWTEKRNMEAYLKFLSEGKVDFSSLISGEYPLEEAPSAYRDLREGTRDSLAALIVYPAARKAEAPALPRGERTIRLTSAPMTKKGVIRTAVIGAGAMAQSVHLPNLRKLPDYYHLRAIADISGTVSKQAARRFRADYCATDYREILRDPDVDLVLIATRHHLHARLAMETLQAGKAVFLEKPMALNREELSRLAGVLNETGLSFTVGFNRRFSPAAVRARQVISRTPGPVMINYRVNAGYLPPEHWVHTEEGGGRVIGEACHIFDLFNFFTNAEAKEIKALSSLSADSKTPSPDNFTVQLKYADGSICSLIYTDMGNEELGKEYVEIFQGGNVLIIDDFKNLTLRGARMRGIKSRKIQKGHLEELMEFARYLRGKGPAPIPLSQLISATEISFKADELCRISD